MGTFKLATLIAATIAGTTPAGAQILTSSDPELITELLRSEGYRAELIPAKGDDGPLIRSGAGGANFSIFFNDCTKGKECQSVQFYAGFSKTKMDVAKMNEWNRDKRWGRAYIDKDGDPVIEMDINMAPGGMERALFVDSLNIWSKLIGEFRTRVFAD
ncbi:YbjN domain-containing protein [Sphingomonas sp. MS122]|uniref:YbjN domain-containing protein n=1 Tax=Sphingomonas sp. MS122 TaxID=3412683 RepID=UPI003C2EA875